MTDKSLILTAAQKQAFATDGYLHLPGFYNAAEMTQMRTQFHNLVTQTDNRPKNINYSYMEPPENYAADEFNPKNISGMMDQTLANDYWFDQFTEPRIVSVIVDLLGPNIDFHNGKVRNKPPGFFSDQGWHQDFPYERHSHAELAAAITYLDATDFEAGATEVVPGSHLQGEWPTHENSHTIASTMVSDDASVVLKAQPGDIAIIHVLVVHRAGHNYTTQSRNAIINEYKTAETIDQWNNRCAFAGLPLARQRKLLMPRLYNTKN